MLRRIGSVVFAFAVTLTVVVMTAGGCGLAVTGEATVGPSDSSTSSSTTTTSGGGSSSTSTASSSSTSTSSSSASSGSATSSSSSSGGSCPSNCGGCPNGVCEINCSNGGCTSATTTCPPGRTCRVTCNGEARCKGLTITCPTDAACEVTCTGNDSCEGSSSQIKCGTGQPCNIKCSGDHACDGTKVLPSTKTCIRCEETGSEEGCLNLSCEAATGCKRSCSGQPCGKNHLGNCDGCGDLSGGACPAVIP